LIKGHTSTGSNRSDSMTKEEEITRNLTLIEYYKQQLESIDMQLQYLQATIAEYQRAKMTVEQLTNIDENSELLIPVGAGTFVNGSLKNASKVLIGIGAGLVVEKNIDEAMTKLDERVKRLAENQEKMLALGQRIQTDAQVLSEKTQHMMEETQHQH
jgi:prefoldin alpha subunit